MVRTCWPARAAARATTCPRTAAARWPTSTTRAGRRRRGGRAEALAMYASTQRARPDRVPEPAAMENDLVGAARRGCSTRRRRLVGSVTSGGTESILLAVQTARDARPDDRRSPSMVLPTHGPRGVPQGGALLRRRAGRWCRSTRRPARRPQAIAAAIDDEHRAGRRVRAVVRPRRRRPGRARSSRPQPPPGVCAATSTRASAAGCCRTPRGSAGDVPPWTSPSTGVTSIRVDLHKYAYTPKGASLLLHRDPGAAAAAVLRERQVAGLHDAELHDPVHQVGRSAGGGVGRRPHIGDDGYLDARPSRCSTAMDRLLAGLSEVPALHVVAAPDSTLVALQTDGSCDVFTLADEMRAPGGSCSRR